MIHYRLGNIADLIAIYPSYASEFPEAERKSYYECNQQPPIYGSVDTKRMEQVATDDQKIQLENLPKPTEEVFIDSAVSLLAWFQHRFIFIHPFQDYNGRVGRMLTIFLLLKLGLPAVEIKVETKIDREKYLEAMRVGDEGNLELLEKLLSETLTEALEE